MINARISFAKTTANMPIPSDDNRFPRSFVLGLTAFFLLAGCKTVNSVRTIETMVAVSTTSASTAAKIQATPILTATITASPTPTKKPPMTVVFYGDSLLRVGEVEREAKYSYSFVDNLRPMMDPADTLITANYGGRDAKWAYENLDKTVLSFHPGLVTLWWGFNDLLGCPGFFDRSTGELQQYKLDWLVQRHIQYLKLQVEALLQKTVPVLVVTAIPITGELPWTHFDENNRLIWEKDHWCDYNSGLKQLADAQRSMVTEYAAAGKNVFLVDAWQVFMLNRDKEFMYMDIMHPGPAGAELIAEAWYRVYSGLPAGTG
jgi:lysophospholipase L1-like esterase